MHNPTSFPRIRRFRASPAKGSARPCLIAIVLALVVLVGGESVATACPMCKAGLASEHDRMIQAWGVSIVFLLSMPFLLVTSFSTYMYVLVRRARREEATTRRKAAAVDPVGVDVERGAIEGSPFAQHESVGA